jgi:predicted flavoprotein YhiN
MERKLPVNSGDAVYHFGLSGPIILTLSGAVVDALRNSSRVQITIDLKPAWMNKNWITGCYGRSNAHHKQQFRPC